VQLKAMTFNVFYGGDDYDLEKRDWCAETNGCPQTLERVVAAIRASGADVVGLEEGENNTAVIAYRLGWHASPRTQVVSRFPLVDPPGADGAYVYVEVEPGKVIAFASVHLPSDPYGPYAVRDGAAAPQLDALERTTRLPMLDERLRALEPVVASGMPVVLVGDFNSPSHLDWTQAVADTRDVVRFPYAWPVGERTEAAGFRDTYREAHPDPVATPGFTWTPGGPETDPKEVHDRIDWVLAAGPADTEASEILGEDGGADVDVEAGDPFPSDHRGVVSTLSVEPADMPVLVSVAERNVTVGDDVSAAFSAHGDAGERVTIVPAGTSGEQQRVEGTGGASRGEVVLATDGLEPGPWEALLLGADGEELSRSPFWLYEPGAPVEVEATKASFRPAEPVTFTWRNTPGNRWDWVGLYEATEDAVPTDGGIADDSGDYLYYEYTRTEIEGAGRITASSQAGAGKWPLAPGRYELRLLLDDGYGSVARSQPFTVAP
jgi:endonuclease/exonuclease/phosphatase family metal-dependent hydrolase